jgi:hypothetical protein
MRIAQRRGEALRNYLLKGGFVWAGCFLGQLRLGRGWRKHLEGAASPQLNHDSDLTREHPNFKAQFTVLELPQIPSIQAEACKPYKPLSGQR